MADNSGSTERHDSIFAFDVHYPGVGSARKYDGLTKRELFAAIVMQKIARSTLAPMSLQLRAQICVAHADALIAELEKSNLLEGKNG